MPSECVRTGGPFASCTGKGFLCLGWNVVFFFFFFFFLCEGFLRLGWDVVFVFFFFFLV